MRRDRVERGDRMPLHPEAQALLDVAEQLGQPPIYTLSPEDARAQVIANTALLPPGPDVAHVEDMTIPVRDGEIGARRYEPADAGDTVIVWLHGGGWVICNPDTHDAMCRILANAAGATVISVDYRLAPEHRFPGPLDDCFDAVSWIAAQNPDRRLVLGGDSAGGNLTAACTLRARDAGGPAIAHQILVYPAVDFSTRRPSYDEHGDAPTSFLVELEMEWFRDHYLDPADHADPEASPLLAEDLSGLPPASVVIAEYDPLRDEGLAYAERLREAGVPVALHVYDDQTHAFFTFPTLLSGGREAIEQVAADLQAR
jgi:acetyl esterase